MEFHLCVYAGCDGTAAYPLPGHPRGIAEWLTGRCNRCGRVQMADGRGRRRAVDGVPTMFSRDGHLAVS